MLAEWTGYSTIREQTHHSRYGAAVSILVQRCCLLSRSANTHAIFRSAARMLEALPENVAAHHRRRLRRLESLHIHWWRCKPLAGSFGEQHQRSVDSRMSSLIMLKRPSRQLRIWCLWVHVPVLLQSADGYVHLHQRPDDHDCRCVGRIHNHWTTEIDRATAVDMDMIGA